MMTKNVILTTTLLSLTFLLNSCSKDTKLVNIIDFTPQLHKESSNDSAVIGKSRDALSWRESDGWINTQPDNFAIYSGAIPSQFTKIMSLKNIIAAPIFANNIMYILSEDASISAIDMNTKKVIWSNKLYRHTNNSVFNGGGIIISNDVLFITYGSRDIVALKLSDGTELWRKILPDISRTQPVIYNNLVLIQTISNQLCALDANTGVITWQHDGIPEIMSYRKHITPIVNNDKVIVFYSSGEIFCIDIATGNSMWYIDTVDGASTEIDANRFRVVGVQSQPIISGENLYVASGSGELIKIHASTGAYIWKRKLSDIQSMNKSGNLLFVTTNAKQVAAIDDATNLVIWTSDCSIEKTKKSYKPTTFLSPVVINDTLVIISSDGNMRLLNPFTGEIAKEANLGISPTSIAIGESIFITTKNGVLKSNIPTYKK